MNEPEISLPNGQPSAYTTHPPEKARSTTLLWDSESDPDNPKNWPVRKRIPIAFSITAVGFIASVAFTLKKLASADINVTRFESGFASAATVPAIPDLERQFQDFDKIAVTLTTSLYVLGFGVGPFILAPLSELYGRRPVYIGSLFMFTVLQIGCAKAPSLASMIILRLLAGCFGSVAPSLGPASMSDLWSPYERGIWNSFLSIGVLTGPPMGTVVASFIISSTNWPWIFWTICILGGCEFIYASSIFRETYEPVILRRRASARVKLANGTDTNLDTEPSAMNTSPARVLFMRAIVRPFRFLSTNPICVVLSIFGAYSFAMLYLILVSIPLLFGDQKSTHLFNYGFKPIQMGLSYLGLVVGFILGGIYQMFAQTNIYRILSAKHGEGRPEYRLLPMTISVFMFPLGLLCYGWSAESQTAWIFPQIGLVFFAFGVYVNFQSIQIYLAEAFIPYGASAIAACTLLRCILGAIFPLFGQKMFIHLGYGWAATTLAVLALLAVPIPLVLYRTGGRMRKRFEFRD